MPDSPFWARYPERYALPNGIKKFYGSGYLSEDHQKYLKEDYFEVVGACNRFPRYKNKKGIDPQVKMYLDAEEVEIKTEWGLPTPNQDAAYKSLGKYGKATVNMSPEDVNKLNKAFEYMTRQFYPYMGNSKVLPMAEAIQRLDMSTSSGCPFNEEFTKKCDLFENDPLILEWLEQDWEVLGRDPNWTTIFSSSLKEELRPLEKIAENSIRTFAAGAVDATVHGNRLFVDMNEKMYASYLASSSTIGMTPLKGNWDKLYRKLSVFSKGYALDESQYDSSLREFMMWGCAKFRWQCLRSEDQTPINLQRIKTYYRNLINTVILTPEGILVMKKLGNPSGSVNTVTDNTLILYWLLAYAWIKQAPEDYQGYECFEQNTSKALLGDDNTWTVSDEAHEFYNGRTVIEVWKTVGITTTTDSLEPRLPEELDFLSAHTVFIRNKAVPLYDRNKLMQSLLYAPQAHLTPETTLMRVTCLLQVGWTDLPFRKFCRGLIDFLLQEYDHLLKDDQRWIMAKCQIQTDEFYYGLFTGEKQILYLKAQSYQETQERFRKLDKARNMASVARKTQVQRKRRNQRRGPKKGKTTGKKTANRMPQKRANRAPQSKRRGAKKGGGGASGLGGTSYGSSKARSITVENEEFVTAVTVAAQPAFNVTSYAINPGQATLFPWLSKQAAQWEKYYFEYLEFFYKREVSEFATAGSAGKVIFSVDFDASDAPPLTKQQMEDTIPHMDAMPCENMTLRLPRKELRGESVISKYVRPGGLPGAADIKTYDVGILNVATQGITVNGEVGELRVRYKCVFCVPILENLAGAPTNNQVAIFQSVGNEAVAANSVAKNILYGGTAINPLGIVNTAGSFVLPAGNYLVDYFVVLKQSVAADAVLGTADLQVSGASIWTAGNIPFNGYAGVGNAADESATINGSYFITSNGATPITFPVIAYYTGGAPTMGGSVRFVTI